MVSSKFSILTFNWHEPYIHLLAKTGHFFDLVEPTGFLGAPRRWSESSRPKPENVRIVSMDEANAGLSDKKYDMAICHNPHDMKVLLSCDTPAVMLFHNKLTTELAIGGSTVKREKYLADIKPLAQRADALVFVSESKRADWGFGCDGVVVTHGVDPSDFHAYCGDKLKVLRVGNLIRERSMMLGADIQDDLLRGSNLSVVGNNPSIEGSCPAVSFEQLKSFYSSHRVYLNITLDPYEDGYNLSMLEAMVTGAPVVSYGHPHSPIENGVSGFYSTDILHLRKIISELLQNKKMAVTIGERGREMVLSRFSLARFLDGWGEVLESVAVKGVTVNKRRELA